MTAVCKSCKAPLLWAVTVHGRPMPIDAEPCADGNIALVPDEVKRVLEAVVLDPAAREAYRDKLYKSHYATCPSAAKYRK